MLVFRVNLTLYVGASHVMEYINLKLQFFISEVYMFDIAPEKIDCLWTKYLFKNLKKEKEKKKNYVCLTLV